MWDMKETQDRERRFREKDTPFGEFTVKTKTKWWNIIHLRNVYDFLGVKENEYILDLGCSDGRFLEYASGKKPGCVLFGLDFARNPLKTLLAKNFRSYAVCGDMCRIPFKNAAFDRIVLIQALQQIPSREERINILKNAGGLLKEHGTIVLTVLNRKSWCNLVENGKEGPLVTSPDIYEYLYDPADLREEIEEAGMAIDAIKGVNNIPVRYLKKTGYLGVFFDLLITRL
ncbi:MAG: class I SAM-dependent methyltransferase, partial [Candidatus Omnitrophota bacterium]